MSVSYAGPLPAATLGRRSTVTDRNTTHRNVTCCLFCSEELSRTDHCLRHVKAKHTLESVEKLSHWDTVFNADPLHISARKVKRPDGDKLYDIGYCWDCHHWIPGRTVAQFQQHTCKMRKPYQRKTAAPPPPPTIVADVEAEAEADDGDAVYAAEQKMWSEVRDNLYSSLSRYVSKWPQAQKISILGAAQVAREEADSESACYSIIQNLADLYRSATTTTPVTSAPHPAPPPPPAVAPVPSPAASAATWKRPSKSSPVHEVVPISPSPGGRELR
jgi:hypothetical protein